VSSALHVDDVVAGYGGGDVLRGVSFEVPSGGITCVVGPNGAGKSTLLSVISGLLKPRRGEVTLFGERITGHTPRQVLMAGVVQVPQNHSLFRDMTVRENLDLGGYLLPEKHKIGERMDAVFAMFPQVAEWAAMKAGSLSGGHLARRAVDGPGTKDTRLGVCRDPVDERRRHHDPARRAERAGRSQAI
jgi:ABC-type branched-subunit amino acid transport system ATPase component